MRNNFIRKDSAIVVVRGLQWYVRFGRRQLLEDWLRQHTPEQAYAMYGETAQFDTTDTFLDLLPVVAPKKIRVARVFWIDDLQEVDLDILRMSLDEGAKREGLQVEVETVKLETSEQPARRRDGQVEWMFVLTAIAR